jgi:hypothetical protein
MRPIRKIKRVKKDGRRLQTKVMTSATNVGDRFGYP